ncbi:MAG: hypothetical protein GDA49_11440 [Rhodospirillales bacterium]|nr:hypothetical protein [Rhodospirillales bacterium]
MIDTSTHGYKPKALVGDYVRAGAGAVICFLPLLLIEVVPVMVYILGTVGAIFTAFGLRTLLRHMTTIELSAMGIRATGPVARAIRWKDLSGMKLAYYTTRRRRRDDTGLDMNRAKDWMELKLKSSTQSIALDSSIDGFEAIVDVAYLAAQDRNLKLNDVTRANLDALGFVTDTGQLPDDHL